MYKFFDFTNNRDLFFKFNNKIFELLPSKIYHILCKFYNAYCENFVAVFFILHIVEFGHLM